MPRAIAECSELSIEGFACSLLECHVRLQAGDLGLGLHSDPTTPFSKGPQHSRAKDASVGDLGQLLLTSLVTTPAL